MPSEEVRTRNIYTIIALNIGSLILIAGAIYILKELAILYGIGIGAAIESLSYNVPLSQLVSSTATQITSYRTGILESYIILLVALGTVGVAFTLYLKRF